jgi:hypothetical protein
MTWCQKLHVGFIVVSDLTCTGQAHGSLSYISDENPGVIGNSNPAFKKFSITGTRGPNGRAERSFSLTAIARREL